MLPQLIQLHTISILFDSPILGDASKAKAKYFNIESEQEQRQRPDTSTVMAKRLLSRALNNPQIKASAQDVNVLKEASKASKGNKES